MFNKIKTISVTTEDGVIIRLDENHSQNIRMPLPWDEMFGSAECMLKLYNLAAAAGDYLDHGYIEPTLSKEFALSEVEAYLAALDDAANKTIEFIRQYDDEGSIELEMLKVIKSDAPIAEKLSTLQKIYVAATVTALVFNYAM